MRTFWRCSIWLICNYSCRTTAIKSVIKKNLDPFVLLPISRPVIEVNLFPNLSTTYIVNRTNSLLNLFPSCSNVFIFSPANPLLMTTYTSRTDIMVQGKVESSAQGKLIGAVDTMPAAKDYTDGVVVLFTGTTTDTYVKGRYYRSNGIAWSEADFNLVVDPAPTSGSGNPVSSSGVYDSLAGKQDNLVFDTTPKSGSLNPVTSGGLFTAFSNKLDKTGTAARATADASGNDITTTYATKTEVNAKQDALSFDAAPTSNSANPVTSNGIYEALANKVDVVSGKGLSTNDYTTDEKNKLEGIATGAQVNVIESVKVNGTALTPSNKAVNIDLSNYATKGDVSAIPKFAVTVVASLPTSDISTSTIYLVSNNGSGTNAYDEYIYVNGGWEKIGTTATDLSDYVTTTALNSALAGKQDKLTTGTGISLSGSAISLATSGVTAGSQGSATTIPIINVDAYGRVTSLSSTTVYPPTTPGTSGQYWTSDGNGEGVWSSPATAPSSGSPNLITSGAVHTALAGKQNNLTFDAAPTENSSNPVTSGGLYTMKANLEQAIADAEVNITGAATTIVTNNLLANRALVSNADGKVAVSDVTSTELGYLDGVTSNVQTQLDSKISSIPSAGNATTPVYINSSGVPTACNYSLGAAAAKAFTTSVTDGSTSLVTSGGVYTAVAAKQDKLAFDTAPTSGSGNPVTSGGVYTAIAAKQDKLTFDSTPTSGSSNPVTSGGVFSAINAAPQITVDSALSSTSTNPVQNKVISTALSNKMDNKAIDTTVTSGSSNLITSGAVYTAINNAGGSKTVYTGTLESLFSHARGQIKILRDFWVEYIGVGYYSVSSVFSFVPAMTIKGKTTENVEAYIAQAEMPFPTTQDMNAEFRIYVESTDYDTFDLRMNGMYWEDMSFNWSDISSSSFTKLNSDTVDATRSGIYYRIWV